MTALRLLYSSNAFWAASGYGVQGKSLLPRLAALPQLGGKQNIAQFAWWGLQGGIHEVDGFRIYPQFNDPYGNDVIGSHAQHFGANWVVTLIDAWVLRNTAESIKPALFCPWLPIDHDPVPEAVLQSIKGAYMPITYAKWGHELLTKAGVENVYIPHGIETGTYRVNPNHEQARDFKRQLTGIEDAFLCVMVAANKGQPDRKWFQGQYEAFRDFAKDKPNVRLYHHTLMTQHHGGVDLKELANQLGLQGRVIFPNPYMYQLGYPPDFLAHVYNAADVLLAVAMSEGFGIPIIEAQACGCPVITTNFSAMPELVRWGHLVDVADLVYTPMKSYQAWPSKSSMLDKLQRLYEAWEIAGGDWPLVKRVATSAAIHAEYDWDAIVRDQWAPFVERVAEDAPPLNLQYRAAVAPVPAQDDVADFVDAVQEGIEAERKPQRRIAPLVKPDTELTFEQAHEMSKRKSRSAQAIAEEMERNGNGAYEAVSDEEAQVPA